MNFSGVYRVKDFDERRTITNKIYTTMVKKVFNLLILDESGSMSSIEHATVSGLNETIQSMKHAQEKYPEQEHFVSLMSFNSEGRKYHYDCTPANDIMLFDGKDYEPDSCTPLYDVTIAAS